MKHIRILVYLLLTAGVFSCGKNFGDLSTDPNNPSEVPPDFLLTNAQKSFADQNISGSFYAGLWAQYYAQNNYTDVSRYAYYTFFWAWYYSEILEDLREVRPRLPHWINIFSATTWRSEERRVGKECS